MVIIMTTEEKARAYDEALSLMKDCIPDKDGYVTIRPSDIFPELAESEDERIRKAIIEFFELQDDNTTYSLVPKKDILAWLKKQGEQKWTEEDESKVKEIVYFLDTAKVHYASTTALDDCIEWLKSLKQHNL